MGEKREGKRDRFALMKESEIKGLSRQELNLLLLVRSFEFTGDDGRSKEFYMGNQMIADELGTTLQQARNLVSQLIVKGKLRKYLFGNKRILTSKNSIVNEEVEDESVSSQRTNDDSVRSQLTPPYADNLRNRTLTADTAVRSQRIIECTDLSVQNECTDLSNIPPVSTNVDTPPLSGGDASQEKKDDGFLDDDISENVKVTRFNINEFTIPSGWSKESLTWMAKYVRHRAGRIKGKLNPLKRNQIRLLLKQYENYPRTFHHHVDRAMNDNWFGLTGQGEPRKPTGEDMPLEMYERFLEQGWFYPEEFNRLKGGQVHQGQSPQQPKLSALQQTRSLNSDLLQAAWLEEEAKKGKK